MATPGPKIEDRILMRIGWKPSPDHDYFYKVIDGYAEGEFVFEILSNFSMFLGYQNSTGVLEEWDEEELKWIRKNW